MSISPATTSLYSPLHLCQPYTEAVLIVETLASPPGVTDCILSVCIHSASQGKQYDSNNVLSLHQLLRSDLRQKMNPNATGRRGFRVV